MFVVSVDNTPLFRALVKIYQKDGRLGGSIDSAQHLQGKSGKSAGRLPLYSSHARQILTDVTELRDLVLDKRKEYILCSNAFSMYGAQSVMSDEDRNKFDRETDLAIKQCTKLIKELEVQIRADKSLRPEDEFKHLVTVANLLNVYLKEVLGIIAQLRQIHIRKTKQIRKICRLANLVDIYEAKLADVQKEEETREARLLELRKRLEMETNGKKPTIQNRRPSANEAIKGKQITKPLLEIRANSKSSDGWDDASDMPELEENENEPLMNGRMANEGWEDAELDLDNLDFLKVSLPKLQNGRKQPKKGTFASSIAAEDNITSPVETHPYEPSNKAEQSQLTAENRKLLERFTTNDAELQRIESHVSEIQRLQNLFAEKICEQENDIDMIHSRTVYTLDNLEAANDFIREAIKNQANRRVIMIFCLLVLTFTLLFLDWYNV